MESQAPATCTPTTCVRGGVALKLDRRCTVAGGVREGTSLIQA